MKRFASHKQELDALGPKGLGQRLNVAIGLVEALLRVHAAGLAGPALRPDNLEVDPESGAVRLMDQLDAVPVGTRRSAFRPQSLSLDELPYVAPEFAANEGGLVTVASDMYILGMLLYAILAGELPFQGDSLRAWLHWHKAGMATPLKARNETPAVLSDIVTKLLAKSPQARYQGCEGLLHDLGRCREAWSEHGEIPAFALGEADFAAEELVETVRLPQMQGDDGPQNPLAPNSENAPLAEIIALMEAGEYEAAIDTALDLLAACGWEVRKSSGDSNEAMVRRGLKELRWMTGENPSEKLGEWRSSDIADTRTATELIVLVSGLLYERRPHLFALLYLEIVRNGMENGFTEAAPLAWVTLGLLSHMYMDDAGDRKFAWQCGEVGLRLLEENEAHPYGLQTQYVYAVTLLVREAPYAEVERLLERIAELAAQRGDTSQQLHALDAIHRHRFWQGAALDALIPEIEAARALQTGQAPDAMALLQPVFAALTGAASLRTAMEDAAAAARHWQAQGEATAAFRVLLGQLLLAVVFEEHGKIPAVLEALRTRSHHVRGLYLYVAFAYFEALAICALPRLPEDGLAQAHAARLDACIEILAHWHRNGEAEMAARLQLLRAERAQLHGQSEDAIHAYEAAIRHAEAAGSPMDLAVAHEYAGRFYYRRGLQAGLQRHLQAAYAAFADWGASAKLRQLQLQYAALVAFPSEATLPKARSMEPAGSLALTTILQTARAISEEVVPAEMLEKTLHAMIEWAGAARGCLLLRAEEAEAYELEAEGKVEAGEIRIEVQSLPMTADNLPVTLIAAAESSGTSILLAHALQESAGQADPYVLAHRAKSLMLTPVIHQGRNVGMMVFENHLSVGAFTPQHLDLFSFLGTQIGLSLENAKLYMSLEKKVSARTESISNRLETLSQQKHQLEELYDLRNQLTAMIAHDLKNPLNGIMGITARNPEDDSFQRIKEWGAHMLGMINDMVDLQKLEDAALQLRPATISGRVLVEEAIGEVSGYALQTSRSIGVRLPADLSFEADPGLLRRVLSNLLGNALIHHPDLKRVDLRIVAEGTDQTVQGDQTNGLRIEVRDEGTPVPEADRARIFEKYYQSDSRKQQRMHSSGLGLAFCKLAVEAHGGRMGLDCGVERGNTFWLTLPVAVEAGPEVKAFTVDLGPRTTAELSTLEMAGLKDAIDKLRGYRIHELTNIKSILRMIDADSNGNIARWKKEVLRAVYASDQAAFDRLLAQ